MDTGLGVPADRSTPSTELSRRHFLTGGAATALVLGFSVPGIVGKALAADTATVFAPNAFLRLSADGGITVICGSSEMGQGVLTAIPMLLAEELDADWSAVRVEQAPADQAYANPMFGMQGTGGSTTVRAFWLPLRKAGAAAREMLVAAAAERWHLDPALLKTDKSVVVAPDGRRLGYGELVAAASSQPVPANPVLKDPKDFRVLGQPLKRLDTPAKVNGSAKFGLDADVPGLLVAVMARAPLHGATPASMREAAARAVRGVHDVVTLDSGVAVLADGFWAAKKGRDALAVEWDLGANAGLSSVAITQQLTEGADTASAVAKSTGDVSAARSGREVRALYEAPYLAHACMEPMNCTAWVHDGGAEIWAGTQSQGPLQGIVARVAQVPPDRVKINTFLLGGGFGRRFAPDFATDATRLSKASGRPVKLVYTREDDMAGGYYRPAAVVRFAASLDAAGAPTSLEVGIGAASVTAASGFGPLPESGVDSQAVEGIVEHPYAIANQRIAYGRREPGPQVWFWRSVGNSQNIFFIESFIDELAAAAKRDPLTYRLGLLAAAPRHRAVLERAAREAGWGTPPPAGVARGIAVAESFGSYVAEVAEVSVGPDGAPRVHRVVAAVDCGHVVNPEIVRRQIEGAIVYGLTAALYGQITFKDGRVEQSNFHDYPLLRMRDMPKVEVHLVPSTESPGGIGEPGTPPIAPAVANAIFAATGKRLRKLPFDVAALKPA
jgi:isoquinoline 1-oxidoreductase beta subunit